MHMVLIINHIAMVYIIINSVFPLNVIDECHFSLNLAHIKNAMTFLNWNSGSMITIYTEYTIIV